MWWGHEKQGGNQPTQDIVFRFSSFFSFLLFVNLALPMSLDTLARGLSCGVSFEELPSSLFEFDVSSTLR